jgi:hypothetical protein
MIKKIGLILFVAGLTATSVSAQDKPKDGDASWTISKDVQRHRLKGESTASTLIQTGNADWAISKGVHRASKETKATGNVVSTGYPTWTISKGAARQQAERNKRK